MDLSCDVPVAIARSSSSVLGVAALSSSLSLLSSLLSSLLEEEGSSLLVLV